MKSEPGASSAGSGLGGGIGRLYRRYALWCSTQPRRAALLLVLLSMPALFLTGRMFSDVQAGLQELLPHDAPSVRALEQIHDRLGGQSHVSIVAQSPDAAANRRFITTLCARLTAAHIPEARSIQGSVSDERKWVRDHAALLMPLDKFDTILATVDEAVGDAKAKANPFFVDLDGPSPAAAPGGDAQADQKADQKTDPAWEKLSARIDEELGKSDRFPLGYMETPDGHTVVAMLWLQGSDVDVEPAERLMAAIKREVAALRPDYPRDMVVAYQGEAPGLLEEHAAILADLSLSSVLVFLLVGGLILAYFRSLRGLCAVLFSLAPGLLFTFGIARLTIGHINSNTAFLGSIIAGNGINYPLLLLAFYRARPSAQPRAEAILSAARHALPGTLAAAATASAAYAGLAASTFKGFSQFGWIGGIGMVTTWAFTYVAMPIAIPLFDPPRQIEAATGTQSTLLSFFSHRRRPWLVASAFVAATLIVGGYGVRRALHDGLYEMDLRALRNRESLRTGSGSWDAKMIEVFGVWLNPVAGLVDDPSRLDAAAQALRRSMTDAASATDGLPLPPAERVQTIADYAPPPADQEARLVRLRKLATTFSSVPRERIPERARPFVDAWLSPENLRVITAADVPLTLRQPFTEVNGRTDRVVLVFPSLKINYNDGNNILRFADHLASAKLPEGAVAGGGFVFMAEIIRLVRDEAPRVVLVVCLLVGLVLIPFFLSRPLRIPMIVATVAVVAIASQALMLALGVQLNMVNFAAVPITIGVGADYVLNLLGAMDALEVDARRACARMGGAILLCSLTTVVGYASLLVAQSGALRTFGWAAVLGEVMAVTTVLFVLPVLLAPRIGPSLVKD